jgi:hypothetical protein
MKCNRAASGPPERIFHRRKQNLPARDFMAARIRAANRRSDALADKQAFFADFVRKKITILEKILKESKGKIR